ncbi:MAG: NYN domain-containing protein [Candidatus Spechtbacteria bacterium]|nr:NYN domain-containing protein [Candidatus Spechtbacteria bacterium]
MDAQSQQELQRAWHLLRERAKAKSDGSLTPDVVYDPLNFLKLNGSISYEVALRVLRQLEKAGYIRGYAHANGTRLLYIRLLKTTDLGEDILGPLEQNAKDARPVQVVQNTTTEDSARAPRGVMLLVDYRNIQMSMLDLGTEFPGTKLIEAGRKYGILKRSLAFIPPHISAEEQTKLRRGATNDGSDGYRIISCPSVKDGGGDSVDKTLDEWVKDFLDHPDMGTFIIVSNDKDFGDTMGAIANHGKNAVVYRVNPGAKQLVSNRGDTIPLTVRKNGSQTTQSANGVSANTNIFETILSGLKNNGKSAVPESNPAWHVLKKITNGLRERKWASDDGYRKNFTALCQAAWNELYTECSRMAKKQDFADAFTALRNHRIIVQHSQAAHPRTYYVFDPRNPLLIYFVS